MGPLDADEVKALIPEYQQMLADGDPFASSTVHEESSYLSKMIAQAAMDNRFNIVMDVVGDAGKFVGKLEVFHRDGYTVHVDYISTNTEDALTRAKIRQERTGRRVDPAILRHDHAGAAKEFHKVAAASFVKRVRVFDGNGAKGDAPRLAFHQEDGKVHGKDPELYQRWLDKADEGNA